MKYLKKYHQLIKEASREQESLVEEALKEIRDKNYIEVNKQTFEAISFIINDENFSDSDMKFISSNLDKIKLAHKSTYYVNYHPSDFYINYNEIAGEFRDKLTIEKYEDDYYTIKNEWGEIGQSGGNVDFYFCDGFSGIFRVIQNFLWFYSHSEEFVKKSLTKTAVNTYLQDILVNNEVGNDYKYNLLFYKFPIAGELIVKKLIEDEGDIIEILKEYKLYNASNLLFLLEKGYINKEVILEFYPNQFRIVDNQLYLIFQGDDLSDFDFMYEKDYRKYIEDVTKEDLDDSIYDHSSYSDIDDIYSGDLTDKAVNAIKAKIEEVKKTMDKEELEEFEDYDDWEEQLKNIDALEDIKWSVVRSYNEAQRDADYDQKYNAVLSPLKYFLGTPEKFLRDENGNILFKFSNEWVLLYDSVDDSRDESYFGKNNTSVGILGKWILKNFFEDSNYTETSPKLLEVDIPYHGWSGDIDETNLEERIIENL